MIESICVFCGSSSGSIADYEASAVELGKFLASQKIRLVYGGKFHDVNLTGGDLGLMGTVANTVLQNEGRVLGVLPKPFLKVCNIQKESSNVSTILVDDMHTRKQTFLKNSDAFITLPGGFGTFEELLECITWKQLGIHNKHIIVFDPTDFFKPLLDMFVKAQNHEFINRIDLVTFCKTISEVCEVLQKPLDEGKGLDLDWHNI